ncbi:hypothetical protein [Hyphomicrobium sp.]|uniref:hypothetical protein n=1 Tax=Hyphomicrobium sp. TaxID=82 RepID=UPI0025BC50F0|nr:hypothetical protein [Hyphomicrobium sp.]MCC7254260.1 hypothetical protein [Hyphomicrobium sp.]
MLAYFTNLNKQLAGWEDSTLTALLVLAGAVVIIGAFALPPVGKAALLTWIVAP